MLSAFYFATEIQIRVVMHEKKEKWGGKNSKSKYKKVEGNAPSFN
jgi:hypothetical protein